MTQYPQQLQIDLKNHSNENLLKIINDSNQKLLKKVNDSDQQIYLIKNHRLKQTDLKKIIFRELQKEVTSRKSIDKFELRKSTKGQNIRFVIIEKVNFIEIRNSQLKQSKVIKKSEFVSEIIQQIKYYFRIRIFRKYPPTSKHMNSVRSSVQSNNTIVRLPTKRSLSSKANSIQQTQQRVAKKIANKYSTCQNYMIISEINRTIMDKQCILKSTVNDIIFDRSDEQIQLYYPMSKSNEELPELIEYYKYYSQKTMLFTKDYFPLLYQYQQKRKIIEYNRLKVLLNLSDSHKQQNSFQPNKNPDSPSVIANRSRIGISRNLLNYEDSNKNKDLMCSNILDQLSLSNFSTKNQHQESLLIKRLRNNLSKHIGPSNIKNMSIEELDRCFDFQNKKQVFKPFKENNSNMNFTKSKLNSVKPKKGLRQTTSTNTPEQTKQKGVIRRRSAKRNNSCQNLIRISVSKTPYEPANCKIKRKKNFSMDNLNTNTSTPHMLQEKRDNMKLKKIPSKGGDRYQKEKQNTHASKGPQKLADTISDLKIKIQKEKQRFIKASNGAAFASLKRQKNSYTSLNTANQRFSKKNYDKLREKTINVH